MGFFSGQPASTPALQASLARVERKLDAIMAHLGIVTEDDGFDPLRALVEQGKKIEAIKLYRELTGASLYDAKHAVETGNY